MENLNEELLIIDQLNEGIDWFKLVFEESKLEIAKRVKATPTSVLKTLIKGAADTKGAQKIQREFAKKELALRQVTGDNESGDPRYKKTHAGYDKLSKLEIDEETSDEYFIETPENFIMRLRSSDDHATLSANQLIEEAFQEYYNTYSESPIDLKTKRAIKIVSLIEDIDMDNTIRAFVESPDIDILTLSSLEIKEAWASFMSYLHEETLPAVNEEGKVECIIKWGGCRPGDILTGVWKQAARPTQLRLSLDMRSFPATSHPIIFFNKDTKKADLPKHFKLL